MFYVLLTIVILVVFATIFSVPGQKQKVQTGGYQDLATVNAAIDQLSGLRQRIEGLRTTIESIAPKLPEQTDVINEIQTTLASFQTDFFKTLDTIASNVETQLS
jgi:peptidoglycan hydrolase CwlO-like protein